MEEISLRIDETEVRLCSLCNDWKEISDYYGQKKYSKSKGHYIYYPPYCKECTILKAKNWQDENYDRYQEGFNERARKRREIPENLEYHRIKANEQRNSGYQKEWQKNNKDKIKLYGEDRRYNKTHEISKDEWEDCKNYFNYRCAYCGLEVENHFMSVRGKLIASDLHKEHVNHDGLNDLSNCVPSCKNCNSRKWKYSLEDWYNKDNEVYDENRYKKILNWLDDDYTSYLKHE